MERPRYECRSALTPDRLFPQQIHVGPAVELIVAEVALDAIVPRRAIQDIGARAANHAIRAVAALDPVVASAARRRASYDRRSRSTATSERPGGSKPSKGFT